MDLWFKAAEELGYEVADPNGFQKESNEWIVASVVMSFSFAILSTPKRFHSNEHSYQKWSAIQFLH